MQNLKAERKQKTKKQKYIIKRWPTYYIIIIILTEQIVDTKTIIIVIIPCKGVGRGAGNMSYAHAPSFATSAYTVCTLLLFLSSSNMLRYDSQRNLTHGVSTTRSVRSLAPSPLTVLRRRLGRERERSKVREELDVVVFSCFYLGTLVVE